MTKKKITAAELMARLNADPEFVAKSAREEEERLKREAEYRRAEQPLLEELHAAGFPVNSAWDFVNSPNTYGAAIPILMAHVGRPYPGPVREGIARALGVPGAPGVDWKALVRLYIAETESRPKSGLAVALAAAASDDRLDELTELASDPRHGSSRLLLLSALERSADPRARTALIGLGTDPGLAKEIQVILRRLKRVKR